MRPPSPLASKDVVWTAGALLLLPRQATVSRCRLDLFRFGNNKVI